MKAGRVLGIWVVVLALLAALGGPARATATRYQAALEADGVTLGTASGTLEIVEAKDGQFTWTLSDGSFAVSSIPHATVVFDEADLLGSGVVQGGAGVTLKEFDVTRAQSTGVDVTYRFRFVATVDKAGGRDVAIRQMK